MSDKEFSRRAFLTKASALGLAAVGSGVVLSACGGGADQTETGGDTPAAEPEAPAMASEGCNDLTGLTDAEKQMRQTLAYVDESPMPEKLCSNCQLFIPPEEGATCGGCQVLKGPIAPGGYCTSWAAKVT